MIIVDGLEDAIVGHAKVRGNNVVVYSVDRLSILIDKDLDDSATPDEVRDIVRFLEESVTDRASDERVPPPVFVYSADWEDILDMSGEDEQDDDS
tara:strand:+ start:447 stop:731 length:285 start_codon:yes stop_codon:yes gene_type:complete